MKLKGLAKTVSTLLAMLDAIKKKIDDLDPDGSQYDEKDTFLNDAYMDLDEALEAVRRVEEMKLEHYL